MFRLFRYSLFLSLLVIASQNLSADVASLSSNYVAGQADIVDKLNDDRTKLVNSVNNVRGVFAGGVQTSGQIQADTIGEENMADDANPRIRTAEGASCADFVSSGFLASTSATLIGSVPSGTAYPDGYYINKSTATAHTFTSDKLTYVYILNSGSLDYQEVAIDANRPADPSNSAVLFRVSTNSTAITDIQDLRKTSCATGDFNNVADVTGEATLEDILKYGAFVRKSSATGRTPQGLAHGAFVSWNSMTALTVTPGCLVINGKFRCVSLNTTVPSTADNPANGVSGLDTGTLGASTRYYIYAIADVADVKTYSISMSTNASAPTGVTNSRLLGSSVTDAAVHFTSENITTVHAISEKELPGGWVSFDGTPTIVSIKDSFNVSSITDNGTGDYTISWDADFARTDYAVSGSARSTGGAASETNFSIHGSAAIAAGSVRIQIDDDAGAVLDATNISVIAIGDTNR